MLWFGLRDRINKLQDMVSNRAELNRRHIEMDMQYYNRKLTQEITLLHEYLGVEKIQEGERLVRKEDKG